MFSQKSITLHIELRETHRYIIMHYTDHAWLAPAALIFYLFAIPIALSFAMELWEWWKMQRENVRLFDIRHEQQQQHLHFVANISHELRTPLTLISAPLKELVDHNEMNAHDRELLNIMQRSVVRLNHLAEQILDTSNHERDDLALKVTMGDIGVFIETIVSNFRFYAHEKGLHLVFDKHTEGRNGFFDMEKIEKIVSNLMSNAIKYTPEGGEIVVRVILKDNMAEVIVKDSGIGVTGRKQREMFRRFNRLDVSIVSPQVKGFGVGLHYAQCLAFLHRGRIIYEPNIPQGSRFTLSIPYTKEAYNEEITEEITSTEYAEESSPSSLPNLTPTGEHEQTVMLVEDDYEMRAYVSMLLAEEYNVAVACDGEEALEKLKINIPDIVISDVVMHTMDGFELCTKIKESQDYGYLPVLLLTAKSDLANRRHGADCGADAYIGKPFDPYYLKSVVASILENRCRIQRIILNMTSSTLPSKSSEEQDVKEEEPIMSQRDRDFLASLHTLLDTHLHDSDLNVNTIAQELGVSYSSLYAKVKDLTGQTPQNFLSTYRMNIAMELLRTHDYTVSEVCYKVGASSQSNFSRAFKKQFGVAPSTI